MNNLSNIEIIKKRHSVRSFKNKQLSDRVIQLITAKIDSLQSGYFQNEIKFYLVDKSNLQNRIKFGTYGIFKRTKYFLVSVINENDCNDQVYEDLGYLFELLILYVTGLELGSCWVCGTFNRKKFSEALELDDNEVIPAICPIGYSAENLSIREKIMKRIARSNSRKPWHQLFFEDSLSKPLIQDFVGKYSIPLEMVRLAPSARNIQPWRIIKVGIYFHFYLERMSNSLSIFDSYDFHLVDTGIAMAHFELSAKELNLSGKWINNDPKINLENKLEYIISWETE
ncbi:MAG: nitroreductase family protein [Candidatus Marinimicrobia bacterium]|nr:nitroreductase family protein [Candidatus Neomarinimicrobiota bacterium]